jgi:hypothetical protein
MGYNTYTGSKEYGPRKGLEGPFIYPNGQVCYYDPAEGAYWDPRTDFYLTHDEAMSLQESVFDRLRGAKA